MIYSVLMPIVMASPNPLPIAWGFATSAYQIEGAWNVDGKGMSVWDKWYNDPSRAGQPNANIANDHYHRMKEDIAYLGQLGATAYRFSVAWPRILPDCTGTPNAAGIKFYSDMIDELLKYKVEPILTLFHWETPQACHDRYQSWLNPQIVTDFTAYADIVFQNFGSRLKYILTINEPHAFCGFGFEQAYWPPGSNAGPTGLYRCLHNVNLVHGSVHKLAARKYPQYGLKFGMPLIVSYGVPYDPSSSADVQAAKDFNAHQTDVYYGVFASGDYPPYLRNLNNQWVQGNLLLTFTPEEKIMVANSLDFLGINYYSANYVSTTKSNLPATGPTGGTSWQATYPIGIRGLLNWAHQYYDREIIVTECGTSVAGEISMSIDEATRDTFRQTFFEGIVTNLTLAIEEDKLPIKAFLAWSLLDNFEWNTYDQVFGIIGIDRTSANLTRYVKNSAKFLSSYFSNSVTSLKLPDSGPTQTGFTSPTDSTRPGSGANIRNGAAPAIVGITAIFAIWSYFMAI